MLLEIYTSMLATAKEKDVPSYIVFSFNIGTTMTDNFFSQDMYVYERNILFTEWQNLGNGRYRKYLYGVSFLIQFTYKAESNA